MMIAHASLCSPSESLIRFCRTMRRLTSVLIMVALARAAIMPPPWADPSSNPCASQPRGWQLLYWPADGKCYKIFQVRKF